MLSYHKLKHDIEASSAGHYPQLQGHANPLCGLDLGVCEPFEAVPPVRAALQQESFIGQ